MHSYASRGWKYELIVTLLAGSNEAFLDGLNVSFSRHQAGLLMIN